MVKYRFWPEREPGPLDDAYVQEKWVRPYRPGPWRVAVCLALVLALLYLTMAGLLATLGSAGVVELGLRTVIAGVVFFALVAVLVRVFLCGVWVTDAGVRVLRPLSTRIVPWTKVADVRAVAGPTRLFGTPARVGGSTVMLVLTDGSDIETPVTSRSLDFLGRSEAYDMAAGAVEGWLQQHRRRHRPRPGGHR